ncbi:hypothetical protein ISN45_Aa08g019370, partial [Arabidopsis thaliana x Arabidopsis arenosa]
IGKIDHSHSTWLGACPLKKTKTLRYRRKETSTKTMCLVGYKENSKEMERANQEFQWQMIKTPTKKFHFTLF